MNTWTSAEGLVFVLAHVVMIATGGEHPGAQVRDRFYPLSPAEARNLLDALNEYAA